MKHLTLVLISLIFTAAGCRSTVTLSNTSSTVTTNTASITNSPTNTSVRVTWMATGTGWVADGTPPPCPTPPFRSPVDVQAATAVLYPGQTRGGNYKPHGGFRFDNASSNAVIVNAPADAEVVRGSRYIEQGETQYLLDFIMPCGIMYRFDHLLALSAKLQAVVDQFPAATVGDSRSTTV
ncbi:MAG: hypothetical protein HY975_04490, partial [Candidatus Kerfeldbacteria bacterium]|nr:hypothetical protein [Candidatus Kerfeldbacteria bacterium]